MHPLPAAGPCRACLCLSPTAGPALPGRQAVGHCQLLRSPNIPVGSPLGLSSQRGRTALAEPTQVPGFSVPAPAKERKVLPNTGKALLPAHSNTTQPILGSLALKFGNSPLSSDLSFALHRLTGNSSLPQAHWTRWFGHHPTGLAKLGTAGQPAGTEGQVWDTTWFMLNID